MVRVSTHPLTPDYTNVHFVRAFETFFTDLKDINPWTSDELTTLPVIQSMFFSPALSGKPDSMAYDQVQNGTIRLKIRFATLLYRYR